MFQCSLSNPGEKIASALTGPAKPKPKERDKHGLHYIFRCLKHIYSHFIPKRHCRSVSKYTVFNGIKYIIKGMRVKEKHEKEYHKSGIRLVHESSTEKQQI